MKSIVRFLVVAAYVSLGVVGGCGGGGGSGNGSTAQPVQNTQPLTIDLGPANTINVLFTTVTICAPGSSTKCQTIDHVQVDTGSSGLRIIASVLDSATLGLTAQTDASGNPIVECMQFVDGYSWGPVRLADIRIAGEAAGSVPIQVIGDPGFPAIPSACSSSGPAENTVAGFGANGILGVGYFLQDCGTACVSSTAPGMYYACPANGPCQPATLATAKQVANPAALFGNDNNGVIIDLAAIVPTGAATATGSLIFGIGTQSDNGLGSATVLSVNSQNGLLATVYNGKTYSNSFFDCGSSVTYIGTNEFPVCAHGGAGLYCPSSLQTLSASARGANGRTASVTFMVGNGDQLISANPTFAAFNDLASPSPDATGVDWGLPFYYGRRVFTAFEGRSTPGGAGPYLAY